MTVVAEDSAAAKRAARILVAFYISSMPEEQLARHGIELAEVQPVVDALGAGDVAGAIEQFTPELAERLSLAGTPEECVEKIKTDIAPAGVNHMILAICRRPPRRVLLRRGGRERARRQRAAQARRRAGDAGLQLSSAASARAASAVRAPSSSSRARTRCSAPHTLSTAAGRPATSSAAAETPHSAGSSSPCETAQPRARTAASSSRSAPSVGDRRVGEALEPDELPSSSSSGSAARNALPVDVACSGTAVAEPVRRHHVPRLDLVGVDELEPARDGEVDGLAGGVGEPAQDRVREADERLVPRGRGEPQHGEAEPVAVRLRVALDEPVVLERREDPPRRAAVEPARVGERRRRLRARARRRSPRAARRRGRSTGSGC